MSLVYVLHDSLDFRQRWVIISFIDLLATAFLLPALLNEQYVFQTFDRSRYDSGNTETETGEYKRRT